MRLLVEQNFNGHILDGLLRREPELDVVHVRDVGLAEAADPAVLEWAAAQDRILLTHDRRTIPRFVEERTIAGLPMPGVFPVNDHLPTGQAIEELLLAIQCLSLDECKVVVKYFPL